ncbi:MAG: IclR family transcriptional regulator [Candidatus Omnitrophica bacterium]|nr:IclR family transcriptional regulator [Candidatus Omnitrophota bacterium]
MKIKVIEKIMKIIEVLTNNEEGYSVGQIAKILNLKVTTTHSLLSTLFSLGYLDKDEKTKKYRISEKFLNIFTPLVNKNLLLKTSEPIMKELAETIKESVVLSIFYKGERYTIAQVNYEGHILNVNLNMFQKASCYSTATGRILLSYLPEEEIKEYIKKNGYPGANWGDIKNLKDFKKEFKRIKKNKIEIIEKENTVAIGVPIFDSDRKIVASLGVYLPKIRFKGGNKKKIISELKKKGEEITLKLGGSYE